MWDNIIEVLCIQQVLNVWIVPFSIQPMVPRIWGFSPWWGKASLGITESWLTLSPAHGRQVSLMPAPPPPWPNFRAHLASPITINGNCAPNSPPAVQSIYLLMPGRGSRQKDWQHCSHCLKVPLCVENCLNGGIMNNHQIGAFSSWEKRKALESRCHMTEVISRGGEGKIDSVSFPSSKKIGSVGAWSTGSLSLLAIYLVTFQGMLG